MASNKETVINVLSNIASNKQFINIQIGLFGSYARNQQTNNSDIDLVLKGTKPLLLVYDGIGTCFSKASLEEIKSRIIYCVLCNK